MSFPWRGETVPLGVMDRPGPKEVGKMRERCKERRKESRRAGWPGLKMSLDWLQKGSGLSEVMLNGLWGLYPITGSSHTSL